MKDQQMNLLAQYFNTVGASMPEEETERLYLVLKNADAFDGFVSEIYVKCRQVQETIIGAAYCRYKIIFDAPNRRRIDHMHKYKGSDGRADETRGSGDNAETRGYDLREVLNCLRIFSWELQ